MSEHDRHTIGPATNRRLAPAPPQPRGPLSDTVLGLLNERAPHRHLTRIETSLGDADPWGGDLQLALYVCYELHYRGFAGVHPRWEWDPALLHLRARMEDLFLEAVRRSAGPAAADDTPLSEMERLSIEPAGGGGLSAFLRDAGTWEHMREYFAHRSLYHLKEADPHAWVIPRLAGQAKASFVAVEFDEYGAGKGSQVHQELFADLLEAAGLESDYLFYLDASPAPTLAVVNLMSLFGLHREHRGAAVGHFAATEITSPPAARRMVAALRRLDAPAACTRFYSEHVEADAVHEQVIRLDVVGNLVAEEPDLADDIIFGMRAFGVVEDRFAEMLMMKWAAGESSLR